MKDSTQLQVTKPLKWYNKQVKTDFKKLFLSLTKAVVMKYKGDYYNAAKEAIGVVDAFELKKEPGGLAYLLILSSMVNAAHDLAVENQLRFRKDLVELEKLYDDDDYVKFLDELNSILEKEELTITYSSLTQPRSIEILPEFCRHFSQWVQYFGLAAPEAENLANRLPAYFVMAFNKEWSKNASSYQTISETLFTPATQAATEELEWKHYNDFLIKEVEAPVFDEPFSLRQIYVPLRAYYKKKIKDKEKIKVVVQLEDVLNSWLATTKAKEAVKVISGGPGSGKSSFAKIWAAQLAEKESIRVLFIPLHFFDLTGDLVDAVGKFIERNADIHLSYNPLKRQEKVLLIFDGLDELSQQGEYAASVAQQFVTAIHRQSSYCNRDSQVKVFFLLTGRELVIQSNEADFRSDKQVIHLLPYYLNDLQQEAYQDDDKILAVDQRDEWWIKYGSFSGRSLEGIPTELKIDNITDVTAQPLLNYLVALSWQRDKIDFTNKINLNDIYNDLIEGVHERAYEGGRSYKAIESLSLQDFRRILEEIAIAAWHGGDTRTTTVDKIYQHVERSGLKPLLHHFQKDAKSGITRLLTAFYFREYGIEQGERTFEFTHKSFGEYLTATRLVREVEKIQRQVKRKEENYDEGYDKQEALKVWLNISGESPIDSYLLSFIRNEIKQKPIEVVASWQVFLADLIGYFLKAGFPIYNPTESIQANLRYSRNAGEALLVMLNACAIRTQKVSEIDFSTRFSFKSWLSELSVSSTISYLYIYEKCLNFISLKGQGLFAQSFYRAHLNSANLEHTTLIGAFLVQSHLVNANLSGAKLLDANLSSANLSRANLRGANLRGANLRGVILSGAKLSEANLSGVDLSGVDLSGVDLREADLSITVMNGVNLKGAFLLKVNLTEASLKAADLRAARLTKVILTRADLTGANLKEVKLIKVNLEAVNLTVAHLTRANLTRANLTRANLLEANLLEANLTGANLTGASLRVANLTGANLRAANLTGANLRAANLLEANLLEANLTRANLRDANLRDANLRDANLRDASLNRADLGGVINLEVKQLLTVKSLFKVIGLNPDIEASIKKTHAHLFEA